MRKKIILIALAFLILPVFLTTTMIYRLLQTEQAVTVITLTETGYNPQQTTIKKGETIEFKEAMGKPFWPASDLHPTHGIYPEFDPESPIDADKSWSFTFKKSGSWRFHDHLNPFYRGTITVQ